MKKNSNEFYQKSRLPPYLKLKPSSTQQHTISFSNITKRNDINDLDLSLNIHTTSSSANLLDSSHNNDKISTSYSQDTVIMGGGGGGGGKGILKNNSKVSMDDQADIAAGNVGRSISSHTLSYPSLIRLRSSSHQSQQQMYNDDTNGNNNDDMNSLITKNNNVIIQPTWRLKERVKTVGVSLVLALNIGTDPPDIQRISPCAKLQCWIDPTSMSRSKAREKIGETLETQYSKWQQRAKLRYKRALDPTVDDVRSLCITMRRHAKGERILLHYNGHGVPRPTNNGEIWVFDKDHTQYIPLSVGDLRSWMGKPSILVLDCSGAGILMPFLMDENNITSNTTIPGIGSSNINMSTNTTTLPNKIRGFPNLSSNISYASTKNSTVNSVGTYTTNGTGGTGNKSNSIEYDSIVLAPCSAGEWLPQNPEFPADIFTSCLTTPIPMALRWFVYQNPLSMGFIFGYNTNINNNSNAATGTTTGTGNNNNGDNNKTQSNSANTNHSNNTNNNNKDNNNANTTNTTNGIDLDPMQQVDKIPGQLNDRKTPLGELNWIFAAITDTIAWNVLPSSLFQRLFRQDLLVAGLFRNFLLAIRILKSLNCTPVSNPILPEGTEHHPLWQSWDLAVETCLFRLVKDGVLGNNNSNSTNDNTGQQQQQQSSSSSQQQRQSNKPKPQSMPFLSKQQQQQQQMRQQSNKSSSNKKVLTPTPSNNNSITSPFFAEQLTAFEIWLDYALSQHKNYNNNNNTDQQLQNNNLKPPEQLPVVLQVLLSQVHRVRALTLLNRFLDLGPYAINLALSVGIFPYVLKLLNSHVDEYKHVLIGIWAKILSFDYSCQVDLVKDGALLHFINHLNWGLSIITINTNQLSSSSSSNNLQQLQHQYQSIVTCSSKAKTKDKIIYANTMSNYDNNMQRIMAAFILSVITLNYSLGQSECIRQNLHGTCSTILLSVEIYEQELLLDKQEPQQQSKDHNHNEKMLQRILTPEYRMWICICVGNLIKDCTSIQLQLELYTLGMHVRLYRRLIDDVNSDVRASSAYALGCLIGNNSNTDDDEHDNDHHDNTTHNDISSLYNTTAHHQMGRTTISPANLSFFPGIVPPANNNHTATTNQSKENSNKNRLLSFDLLTGKKLLESLNDTSITVRYEVIVALSCLIEKYLDIFAAIAVEGALSSSNNNATSSQMNNDRCIIMPCGIDRIKIEEYNKIWISLKHIQRQDPHPSISNIANSIVSYVHEHIVLVESRYRNMKLMQQQSPQQQQEHQQYGIKEENESHASSSDGTPTTYHRSKSMGAVRHHMTPSPTPSLLSQTLQNNNNAEFPTPTTTNNSNNNISSASSVASTISGKIRRNMSALSSSGWYNSNSNNTRRQSPDTMYTSSSPPIESSMSFDGQQQHQQYHQYNHQFSLPKSKFYEWKRLEFTSNFKSQSSLSSSSILQKYENYYTDDDDDDDDYDDNDSLSSSSDEENDYYYDDDNDDPLSPVGAMKAYRKLRNKHTHDKSFALARYYQMLVPNYHQHSSSRSPYQYSNNSIFSSSNNNRSNHKRSDNSFDDNIVEDVLFMDNEEKAAALAAFEAQITAKKRALRLSQSSLLLNHDTLYGTDEVESSATSSSLLRFHAYEPVLVVCDKSDGISIWDTSNNAKNNAFNTRDTSSIMNTQYHSSLSSSSSALRLNTFCNGNPKKSRITSVLWMNEQSSNSLLMTASDDGTVRVWEDLFQHDTGTNARTPTTSKTNRNNNTGTIPALRSAFSAAPELQAGQRGSGLILEWQQYSGNLIAAGNSPYIRCWDMQAEKFYNQFDRKSNACVTAITTAWDSLLLGPNGYYTKNKNNTIQAQADGYSGIGPNIIVAGYGDGSAKVFDIRTSCTTSVDTILGGSNSSISDSGGSSNRRRRQPKLMQYAEHSSWIVDMFFTAYGHGYEVVSGCVGGDIKFYDLRYSSSLRTIDVQRSPMTALAIHPRIPLIATGSHAQFIKIFTLDGDTLDVIRYHDEIHHRRIGPVSNLSFHPHKLMLASGFTDEIVSLYEPRYTTSSTFDM